MKFLLFTSFLLLTILVAGDVFPVKSNIGWQLGYKVDASNGNIHIVMQAPIGSQEYLAFGVSMSGGMSNSDMVIGWVNSDNSLTVNSYYSAGHSRPVLSRDQTVLTNITGKLFQNQGVTWTEIGFIRPMKATNGLVTSVVTDSPVKVIYAIGSRTGNTISYHGANRGEVGVSFKVDSKKHHNISDVTYDDLIDIDNVDNGSVGASPPAPLRPLVIAHAALMIIGWMILIPNGIVTARYMKSIWPSWYKIHRNTQITVVIMIFTSFLLILAEYDWQVMLQVHPLLGTVVSVGAVFEACLGYISNYMWFPGKPPHWLHDKLHWWTGRVMYLGAIANIALGVKQYISLALPAILLTGVWVLAFITQIAFMETSIGQKHEYNQEEINAEKEKKKLLLPGILTITNVLIAGSIIVLICVSRTN